MQAEWEDGLEGLPQIQGLRVTLDAYVCIMYLIAEVTAIILIPVKTV